MTTNHEAEDWDDAGGFWRGLFWAVSFSLIVYGVLWLGLAW